VTETPARPPTTPARRAAVIACRVLGAVLVALALVIAYAGTGCLGLVSPPRLR